MRVFPEKAPTFLKRAKDLKDSSKMVINKAMVSITMRMGTFTKASGSKVKKLGKESLLI